MKVALVHYWLVGMRGGEKVLETLCQIFPEADIYTHVYDPNSVSELLRKRTIHTSFIQKLPLAQRYYQSYLPLMPLALEQLDLREYDLIISTESGPAKGVITRPDALHICYCFTPMRYLWDMYHDYKQQASYIKRLFMPLLTHYLRSWDQASANRVDHFVAISHFIAKRIEKAYRRSSTIIYPPVAINSFSISDQQDDYYLMVGQLTAYKKPELAVEAFRKNGKRLKIIGNGELLNSLRQQAPANVELLGWQSTDTIRQHYARCRALIFPGTEDFGIVPVEAMASGCPVLAYAAGGALDSIKAGESGLFFQHATSDALCALVEEFEASESQFIAKNIRNWAEQFSEDRFKARFLEHLQSWMYNNAK